MDKEKSIPIVQCDQCKALGIPPQYICRQCGHTGFRETSISGRGKVYTHTTIRVAPDDYREEAPYPIVVVDLAHGLRVTARLVPDGAETIEIGQDLVFDRVNDRGYWFQIAS